MCASVRYNAINLNPFVSFDSGSVSQRGGGRGGGRGSGRGNRHGFALPIGHTAIAIFLSIDINYRFISISRPLSL